MAAMAPALTDAPAEAHHIRFKLAAPTSSLSPDSAENNGNASNILLHHHHSGGATSSKRKVSSAGEDLSLDFGGTNNKNLAEQQLPQDASAPTSALGKLQPLVASYLCSDVTPVPSSKESIKLQGVLIKQSVLKSHSILPNSLFNGGGDFLLRKRQTLELSGGQLKSLMSGSPNGGSQSMASVNGLAKKVAMSAGAGCVVAVNGDKPSAASSAECQGKQPVPSLDSSDLTGMLSGREGKGTPKQMHSGVSESTGGNVLQSSSTHSNTSPIPHDCAIPDRLLNSECQEVKLDTPSNPLESWVTDKEGGGGGGGDDQQTSLTCAPEPLSQHPPSSSSPSSCDPSSLDSLDAQVRERTLLNTGRQYEIEGRLRRLRRRLQVVQAKQVERHIQQQLGGFLDTALSRAPAAWRTGTGRPSSSHVGDSGLLGRFLKSGSVPSELEKLYLSGTANLHWTETALDSDVTESSSGGETDLEEEELSRVDLDQRHVKICKRAESLYLVERASIISHWNWLQAHISDLEYRIRQQTDIYRQIRTGKGQVELGGVAPCSPLEVKTEVKAEPLSSRDGISERLESKVSSHIAMAESKPWRGQNGRPVNGVFNRVADCSTDLKPGLQHHPSPSDSTCVAARTRPLLSCKRRRLVLPSSVPNLHVKVQRSSVSQCTCRVNPSCATCGGNPALKDDPHYDLTPLERLSRLDPGVHPILSFTDDVCVGQRLQEALQSQWPSKALQRSRPLKKLKHKLSKDKHRTPNSLLVHRLGHKSPSDKQQRLLQHLSSGGSISQARLDAHGLCKALSSSLAGPYDSNHSRKRSRDQHVLLDKTDRESPTTFRASPKLFLDSASPSSLVSLHSSSNSPLTSLTRQLSTSSDSNTPLGNSQSVPNTPLPIRKRRGESSFDINNIVIPMSVVATTRLEKLQYKEILTPSWREVDIFSHPMAEEEDDHEIEDLSDLAFTQLHQPCQDQEKTRWSWLKLAPAQRRGSRSYKSLDGRSTPLLFGTNPPTPQPASPDPGHCPLLHEYSCAPSPLSPASPDATSNPHTPCSRDSHRLLSNEDTRCSTPDFTFEERTVAPFERRSFPLSEDPPQEPEAEPRHDEMREMRLRMRTISGCRVTGGYSGRLDSDETDPSSPYYEDSDTHKLKAVTHQ